MILVDSNIIIYAISESSPKSLAAQQFLLKSQQHICVAQQNILETLRTLTHPKFPVPMSTSNALKSIHAIVDHVALLSPSINTQSFFWELTQTHTIQGNQVFDAYLIATMLTNGVRTIATDNTKHFEQFRQITCINPFYS